jgi:DEAD/DEAH box helicase domain-containing protein
MLPSVLSHELMEGIEAFLRSAFPTSTPAFRGCFDEILTGTGRDKLFSGPYFRIGLPFQPGVSGRDFFPRLETLHPPYVHQEQAWKRLRTAEVKSTLVATGTGSGKTECFTYPILDHILANPSQRGIKAIILYPMNALAADQARRFAREVHGSPALKGKVRVGLYVGGEESGGGSKSMTETSVITSREELRKSPPDILMTNYKMLDYLLIRQADRGLWAENDSETLRYLVVDELHTFDGAQGSDLACLVRRVKARVKMPKDHLCCVGTSATLGGKGNAKDMVAFAELIFGESFVDDPIINETRKTASAHIENEDTDDLEILYFEPPGQEHLAALSPANHDSIKGFVEAQAKLWFGKPQEVSTLEGRVKLANLLRRHNFLRTFLRYFKGGALEENAILADLKKRRASSEVEHHKLLINSFISLCAVAREAPHEAGYFLQIRAELWMRELSRMVASVSPRPSLRFSMDLPADHPQRHLAAMHCRDCGMMGWGGVQKANEDRLIPELDRFYQAFFSVNPDPRLRFIFPVEGEKGKSDSLVHQYLCGSCLTLFESGDGACPNCGTTVNLNDPDPDQPAQGVSTFKVESHIRTIQRKNVRIADKSCPYCDSSTGLTIVGSRAASLTSVGLSQIFGSPYNDDKKAIAFSDSVQDASHRSGFFTARTYQIALRTAMCRVIDQTEKEISLAELSKRFPAYWLAELGEEDFVGTFIPPSIEWLPEFEDFRRERKLTKSSSLPAKVRDRMEWEVIREFGMQCRIGRTLEKSGAAASYQAPDLLDLCAAKVTQGIRELSSAFSGIAETDVKQLIAAVCERQRGNGGISHRFIEPYIEKRGDAWVFNNQVAGGSLPQIRKQGAGRRPTFFASFTLKDSFERLLASGSTPTWTERWVEKWLRRLIGDKAKEITFGAIIEHLVEVLTDSELWQKHQISKKDHEYAWSLNPDHTFVSNDVIDHACRTCGHQVTTARSAEDLWKDMPCLRHKCEGTYRASANPQGSYFGNLYHKGDIVRLRSSEHTGMLDRITRDRVEAEFMRDPSLSTDTNLLSCTPTMEMGVDVGDLSTVLLCSVPPEQSNYIQRVGRGGRRDGNSLALTVANSDAHDLTFYEDPLKMLAGDVQLPAIFLRAPAVLERQLTAYCIDRWIESDPSAQIPNEMEAIYIQLSKPKETGGSTKNEGVFPNALYRFIELGLTELIAGFEAMFDRKELDKESIDYLQAFVQGNNEKEGTLSFKINRALAAAFKDREGLYKKRAKLNKAIGANKNKSPRDEKLDLDRDQMVAERKGISRLIKEINRKQTLNFLTDEGLIPNYAFPEEGVTLRSVILKKPDPNNEDKKLVKLEFEHIRPAEAAITELAPGSVFYVEGRKLTIDQVSIEKDDYEDWHFCRSCSHLELVSSKSESYSACPRCHCSGWLDTSLRQKMLKMRQVFVTAWDKNVRNLDQKDNRDLTTFNKQTSIDYKKAAIRKSYMLKAEGATFAFDFIDLIILRETNFGEDQRDAESLQIGGKTMHGVGFKVCGSCGKVQSRRFKDDQKHDISCNFYGKEVDTEEFESTFLLYRQLESEAIKLLIPSLNLDENIDTQSFVAAIHLGLKEKFGGHLSHLKLSVQHQPIADSSLKVRHVFIYDSVPGGTGYLKDLTRNDKTLIEVLEKAYDALKKCSCAEDPELDGCYRCVKAYRFRFVNNQISRQTAMRQLKRILDNREAIEERSADESLINPLLESELERRFIEALRQADGFVLNQEVVDGKPGYLLRIQKVAWKVIPQMELGASQGVSIQCRPDFILKPLRPSKGMPIAVFLDGFAFHADVELDNNRIADDITKRNAIRMSGNYLVWCLTWADLKGESPPSDAFLCDAFNGLSGIIKEQANELADLPIFQAPDWNSWDLLREFLGHLAASETKAPLDQWRTAASFLSCNFLKRGATDEKQLRSALEDLMLGNSPALGTAAEKPDFMISFGDRSGMRTVSAAPVASLQRKSLEGALCALWFDDAGDKPGPEFKAEWQELLRSYNMLQFVPRFTCFTRKMLEKGKISNLLEWLLQPDETAEAAETETESLTLDQLEELELIEPSLQSVLVPLLKEKTIPWPEFGYEATTASGQCGASMLEAAWPDRKVGIALPGDDASQFEKDGWKILPAADLTTQILEVTLNSNL